MTTTAEQLGTWVAHLALDDVPENVRAAARSCLVDTIGVALAGTRTEVAAIARSVAAAAHGPGLATALGVADGVTAPAAALVNGAAAHALDYDDNCYAGYVHGSAVVLPAVLGAAETAGASGAECLLAFIAGVEAEYAVGAAVSPSLYEKGWWNTAVLGPIGAAAGAARAMSLDARQTTQAIALATAGTGGQKSCFGTHGKPLLCGRAAEFGVIAALMAARGAHGPATAFEDQRGFARLFNAGTFDWSCIDRLGKQWSLLSPGIDFKRFPVCYSSPAAADGLLAVMAEQGLSAADIAHVLCETSPIVIANLAYDRPTKPHEAQFSMHFALACVMLNGDITLDHLRESVLAEPGLRAAMAKVEMKLSPRWAEDPTLVHTAPEGAFLTVTATDGRTFERFSPVGRGTAGMPLSEAEIDAKFMACARTALSLDQGQALLARLRRIETLPAIGDLIYSEIRRALARRGERADAAA